MTDKNKESFEDWFNNNVVSDYEDAIGGFNKVWLKKTWNHQQSKLDQKDKRIEELLEQIADLSDECNKYQNENKQLKSDLKIITKEDCELYEYQLRERKNNRELREQLKDEKGWRDYFEKACKHKNDCLDNREKRIKELEAENKEIKEALCSLRSDIYNEIVYHLPAPSFGKKGCLRRIDHIIKNFEKYPKG